VLTNIAEAISEEKSIYSKSDYYSAMK